MQIFVTTAKGLEAVPVAQPLALGGDGKLMPLSGEDSVEELRAIREDRGAVRRSLNAAWLVPTNTAGQQECVLFAREGVFVNGARPLAVAVLRRGDVIGGDGWEVYFTDEAPLRVVGFVPGTGSAGKCTRCHRPLEAGEPVVYCPTCGVPYMAQPDIEPNCWGFGPCIVCKRDPRPEFLWKPAVAEAVVPWHQRPWRQALASTLGGRQHSVSHPTASDDKTSSPLAATGVSMP